jgi:hypothetical protein
MRKAEPIAGLGGVLLLVSLFLPWYDSAVVVTRGSAGGTTQTSLEDISAWEAFAVIDVLLALLAALAIAVPVLALAARGPAKPIAIALIASALGWLGVLLVGFRLLDNPGPLRAGAWLALAGALIAWIGSWLSLRDESTPGAVPPDLPRRPAPLTSPTDAESRSGPPRRTPRPPRAHS